MLTGWLNGLNGTNAILLGLILGAMMAIDMGGPINKASIYVWYCRDRSEELWGAFSGYGWWYGATACNCVSNYLL